MGFVNTLSGNWPFQNIDDFDVAQNESGFDTAALKLIFLLFLFLRCFKSKVKFLVCAVLWFWFFWGCFWISLKNLTSTVREMVWKWREVKIGTNF